MYNTIYNTVSNCCEFSFVIYSIIIMFAKESIMHKMVFKLCNLACYQDAYKWTVTWWNANYLRWFGNVLKISQTLLIISKQNNNNPKQWVWWRCMYNKRKPVALRFIDYGYALCKNSNQNISKLNRNTKFLVDSWNKWNRYYRILRSFWRRVGGLLMLLNSKHKHICKWYYQHIQKVTQYH